MSINVEFYKHNTAGRVVVRRTVWSLAMCLLVSNMALWSLALQAAESPPLTVDATRFSPLWQRLYEQTVSLSWSWHESWAPDAATQVTLKIVGSGGTLIEQSLSKPATSCIWQLFDTPDSFREEVYDVTLTYRAADGTPLAAREARLYALDGSFAGAVVKTVPTSSQAWRRANHGVLLPYDRTWRDDTANATVATLMWSYDGTPVTSLSPPDPLRPGLVAWSTRGWPKGTYLLELDFEAEPAWQVQLNLFGDGSTLLVR